MKTEIYYFTGTGNSLIVAKNLAQKLSANLIPIAKFKETEEIKTDAELIGIIFPVYIFGMPLIVEEFAKKLSALKEAYIFGVTTYGGMPAATINQLKKTLNNKGKELCCGFGVQMPGNYTPLYGAVDEKKQNKMFEKMEKKLSYIADYINQGKKGTFENSNFLINYIFSEMMYKNSSPQIPIMDKDYWVDEKCNSCGICEKVCPVCNIEIKNDKPTWKQNCEQCFACLQWCPKTAIQYGKTTSKRKRYTNPNVDISEIINQK